MRQFGHKEFGHNTFLAISMLSEIIAFILHVYEFFWFSLSSIMILNGFNIYFFGLKTISQRKLIQIK
jgi:hypothetical protein